MNEPRTVLVAGATGNQGGAVVRALLKHPETWRVRGLTRNPGSPKARTLAAQGVEMIAGDMADAGSLHAAFTGADAAFSVQDSRAAGLAGEVEQGTTFADAATASGIKHLIYTSVGGADRGSGVPHFETKWRIERHIRDIGIPATILRPTAFMEGFGGPPLQRYIGLGIFAGAIPPAKSLQMIATRDIGIFARIALENPDRFVGQALEIAGEELTLQEIIDTVRSVSGKRRIRYLRIPGSITRRMGDSGKMITWLAGHGYRADIPRLRQIHPDLLTLEKWLLQSYVQNRRDLHSNAQGRAEGLETE
jgi:uncharacterized protein YbjT (DUF2867 family)